MSPEDVITEARRWVGTPYRHQARGPYALDCVGLIVRVASDLKLFRDDSPVNYGRLPEAQLLAEVSGRCHEVATNGPGILVLIRWPGDRNPAHAAFSTGPNLIHCYRVVGEVVEHGFRAPWDRLAHSFWRLPGVSY